MEWLCPVLSILTPANTLPCPYPTGAVRLSSILTILPITMFAKPAMSAFLLLALQGVAIASPPSQPRDALARQRHVSATPEPSATSVSSETVTSTLKLPPARPTFKTCCCCYGETMESRHSTTCGGSWRLDCAVAEAAKAFDREICSRIRCAL